MLCTIFIVLLSLTAVNTAPQVNLNDETAEGISIKMLKNKNVLATSVEDNHVQSEHLAERVINGKDAEPYAFPWAVAIRSIDGVGCGASFINNQWLVTAAHCVSGRTADGDTLQNPKYWRVRAGNVFVDLGTGHSTSQKAFSRNGLDSLKIEQHGFVNRSKILQARQNGQSLDFEPTRYGSNNNDSIFNFHLEKIIVHPNYEIYGAEWDIALIKLYETINLDDYDAMSAIRLPPTFATAQWPTPGEFCSLVGWGCTREGGLPSERAQVASLQVMTDMQCSKFSKYNSHRLFCAGYYNKNIGACLGDSGSGLACKRNGQWYIDGVLSLGARSEPENNPSLYVRVSYFRDWIDYVIKDESYNF